MSSASISPNAPSSLAYEMGKVLRSAARQSVLPRFRQLDEKEIEEKSIGDLVTVADREAEALISQGLSALRPTARAVGEEACAHNPALLNDLDHGEVWIIDPIDGTGNYANGHRPFAIMAALLINGEIAASAILDPLTDRLILAEKGGGAWVNGERLNCDLRPRPLCELSGIVSHFQRPSDMEANISAISDQGAQLIATKRCAGYEYPLVANGQHNFSLYWRTLVWDHAPGVLMLEEAGGKARHLDGSPYCPAKPKGPVLLAQNETIWEQIATVICK